MSHPLLQPVLGVLLTLRAGNIDPAARAANFGWISGISAVFATLRWPMPSRSG
ncbi:hypothetical protein OG729_04420 [Streptomyces sp. NBC_00210]|uniref:hypothetical protein n=1 Tax=unclassified Streptomyces TaxID=2593676 RepID=UPI0032454EED